ncbi:hypothetical protein NBRC10513v2_007468 [Rhodotorula toruloides]
MPATPLRLVTPSPRTSSSSPIHPPSFLTASPPHSPTYAASGGVNEPLLPRSHSPGPGGSRPSTPSRRTSSPAPLSPSSPTSSPFGPFSARAPPKAARLGSSGRKWAAVGALVFLVVVASWGASNPSPAAGQDEIAAEKASWYSGLGDVTNWAWGAGKADIEDIEEGSAREPVEVSEGDVRLPLAGVSDDFEETLKEVLTGDEPGEAVAEGDLRVEEAAQTSEPAPVAVEELSPPSSAASVLNVHPVPRPLPQDPEILRSMRFLSFENHSGFHNQRKSLVNALALAQLLNRTLLLPPARLGAAIPWEPDPKVRVAVSEECKAGVTSRPFASSPNSVKISTGEECDDPAHWTYVGWDYLVTPSLLANRSLIDRWNASHSLFTLPSSLGGLDLLPSEIQAFPDPTRRSYQILDSPSTPLDKGLFTSRLELSDLRSSPARLLQFGSLFSGARLKFVQEENRRVVQGVAEMVVLQNDGLDGISGKVKELLGTYVAAHARVGDGNFKIAKLMQEDVRQRDAIKNMQRVFRKLVHDVFGLKNAQIDVLLAEAGGHASSAKVARAFGREERVEQPWDDEDDEEELVLDQDESLETPSSVFARTTTRSRRAVHTAPPSRPLSPLLTCRSPLHDPLLAPHLAALNTPLYIATDSRSPTTDAALRPFMRWFPCVFFLSDFVELVEELGELVNAKGGEGGGGKWVSEWDQQPLARYLFPFLEAEIAARATEVVGTPTSTFSGYTVGTLHGSYVAQGMAATWE